MESSVVEDSPRADDITIWDGHRSRSLDFIATRYSLSPKCLNLRYEIAVIAQNFRQNAEMPARITGKTKV